MKRLLLAMLAIISPGIAHAETFQADAAIPDIDDHDCATLVCRPGGNQIVLDLGDGNSVAFTVPRTPYVTRDGEIVIYPGEFLLFDFPQATANSLGPPHYLGPGSKAAVPLTPPVPGNAVTLSLELKQEHLASGPVMFFNLQPFAPKSLVADAAISILTPHGLKQKAMTCQLMPKLWDNESWSGTLGPVVLSHFRYFDMPSAPKGMMVSLGCD